jgi:hypothetical protein
MALNVDKIRSGLERLRHAQPSVFGAACHRFRFNPPLRESEVEAFEQPHRIRLPEDYRRFLIELGNGGVGPFYGIFQMGTMCDLKYNVGDWAEEVGILTNPFPYKTGYIEARESDAKELYVLGPEDFRKKYGSNTFPQDLFECDWHNAPVDGSIPICHAGCGYYHWLVLTGQHTGHIWCDNRAAGLAFEPILNQDGTFASFSDWYEEWLDRTLQEENLA